MQRRPRPHTLPLAVPMQTENWWQEPPPEGKRLVSGAVNFLGRRSRRPRWMKPTGRLFARRAWVIFEWVDLSRQVFPISGPLGRVPDATRTTVSATELFICRERTKLLAICVRTRSRLRQALPRRWRFAISLSIRRRSMKMAARFIAGQICYGAVRRMNAG